MNSPAWGRFGQVGASVGLSWVQAGPLENSCAPGTLRRVWVDLWRSGREEGHPALQAVPASLWSPGARLGVLPAPWGLVSSSLWGRAGEMALLQPHGEAS